MRSAPNTELLAGTIIQGTPYVAVYNNTDGAFYLQGFFGNPYNIPLAGGLDYWASTAPNSSFAFPFGQAISRTIYAALYAQIGNLYGAGDGSTTFNLPDCRGRVRAALDNMGVSTAGRLTATYFGAASGFAGTSPGATGGSESHALSVGEMPSHNHNINDPGHFHATQIFNPGTTINTAAWGNGTTSEGSVQSTTNTTGISVLDTGGSLAHAIVQPTICCNYIMRII